MADSQPPEGPRKIIERAIANPAEFVEDEPYGTVAEWQSYAVLAALFEACEVREERRIVIDDEQVTGLWMSAELAARFDSLAAKYASGRVERRLVIGTKPEPVSSTGEEKTGA